MQGSKISASVAEPVEESDIKLPVVSMLQQAQQPQTQHHQLFQRPQKAHLSLDGS